MNGKKLYPGFRLRRRAACPNDGKSVSPENVGVDSFGEDIGVENFSYDGENGNER